MHDASSTQLATAFAHHECRMCSLLRCKIRGRDLISLAQISAPSVLNAGNSSTSSFRPGSPPRAWAGRGASPGIMEGIMPSSACAAAWISLIFLASSFCRRGTHLDLRSSRISRSMKRTRGDSACQGAHRDQAHWTSKCPQGLAVAALSEICTATACLAARDGAQNSTCSGTRRGDQQCHTLRAPCRTDVFLIVMHALHPATDQACSRGNL